MNALTFLVMIMKMSSKAKNLRERKKMELRLLFAFCVERHLNLKKTEIVLLIGIRG